MNWLQPLAKYRALMAGQASQAIGRRNASGTVGGSYIGEEGTDGYKVSAVLQGSGRFRSFRALRAHVFVVAAYMRLVESIAAQARFTPEGDDDRVEDVLSVLGGTGMAEVQANMVEALSLGYSLQEMVLGREGGIWKVMAINRIPQSTIYKVNYDRIQQVDSFVQYSPQTAVIPRAKCLYVKNGSGDWGNGTLMDVAEHGLRLMTHQDFVFATANANLRNVPDISMPEDVYADANNEYKKSADATVYRHATLANSRFTRPSNVQAAYGAGTADRLIAEPEYGIERVDPVPMMDNDRINATATEIAIGLNAQEMLLGSSGSGGSYALAKTQITTLMQSIDGVLARAAEEFQRMLGTIWRLNGWGDAPPVEVDRAGWLDQEQAANIVAQMKGVDLATYRDSVDRVLEQAGLPPTSTGEGSEPTPMNENQGDGGEEMD